MILPEKTYETFVGILKQELVPAMGCTEPIAIAYCAAKARCVLGELPESIEIWASGNIIKNVKSVIVPHTGGLRGMEAAAAAGVLCGQEDKGLEVISEVTREQTQMLREYIRGTSFQVHALESSHILDLKVWVRSGSRSAMVHIVDEHTNIVEIEKDGRRVWPKEESRAQTPPCVMAEEAADRAEDALDYGLLRMEAIFAFANEAELSEVSEILQRQIDYNMAIAKEGMREEYGARIGKVLMHQDTSVRQQAKAMAAAGSDARMSGCELPVVIVSGSGNQGITACVPVVEYARAKGIGEDRLYRALAVSNLLTVHQKTPIGRLSAFCGAVNAATSAIAAIAYLDGAGMDGVAHTLVNSLAIVSGMVCDGAKASCAAKISLALEAGLMGYEMYQAGHEFVGGDGIVRKGVEYTLANVGRLGSDGMRQTDREILSMMVGD